jgi:hypothetical protein
MSITINQASAKIGVVVPCYRVSKHIHIRVFRDFSGKVAAV